MSGSSRAVMPDYLRFFAVLGFVLALWLGFWGRLDRFTAVLIAIAVTAGLMVLLVVWRRPFALVPFVWVLRRMTYAKSCRFTANLVGSLRQVDGHARWQNAQTALPKRSHH